MPVALGDVARAAGVSISTVSRTLSGDRSRPVAAETQERIWDAVRALDYRPKQTPRRRERASQDQVRRTHAVGLILGNVSYKFSDPFWSRVLDGADREIVRQQFRLLCTLSIEDLVHARQRRLLSRGHIDGLVLVGGLQPFGHAIGAERIVVIEGSEQLRWEDPLRVDIITMEKTRAIFRLVDHLVATGRCRIGFLGPSSSEEERAAAFLQALARHGLRADRAWIRESPWTAEGAYAAAVPFLQNVGRSVDALMCGCDTIAIGAMRAAKECGLRLPEDLAITGFDDIASAGDLHPSLTTIRVPMELMGQLAAKRLIERINEPTLPPIIQTVPTSLVIRSSTGGASAGDGDRGGSGPV